MPPVRKLEALRMLILGFREVWFPRNGVGPAESWRRRSIIAITGVTAIAMLVVGVAHGDLGWAIGASAFYAFMTTRFVRIHRAAYAAEAARHARRAERVERYRREAAREQLY